jgi:hypothetical protein
MATKKTAALAVPVKGKTLAKPGSLEEKYAKYAQMAAESVPPPTSNVMSFSQTGMKLGGTKVDGPVGLIVLDYIRENDMYDKKFDPDDRTPPCCYAFGRTEGEMRPHESAKGYPVLNAKGKPSGEYTKPESCSECPMNQWGSAASEELLGARAKEDSKGKACQNRWRLLALPADVDEDTVKTASWALLKLPVTSGKGWTDYVTNLARNSLHPLLTISDVDCVEDKRSQFKVTWAAREPISPVLIDGLEARREEAMAAIEQEYKQADEEPAAEAPAAKKGKGKF